MRGGSIPTTPTLPLEDVKRQAWSALLPELETYRGKLLQERERQAEIKEKYGVQSLEYLILKLDGDLIGLYDRQQHGEYTGPRNLDTGRG